MKRVISLVLTIVLILGSTCTFVGCGNKKSVHILTRGEWVAELAHSFGITECYDKNPRFSDVNEDDKYFNEIQACAEWEVLDTDKKFRPDDKADVNFALSTAVKMIGVDRIEKSVGGKKLKSEKDIIKYFDDNSDMKYISGSSLYEDTANEILADTTEIYSQMELEQYQDIEMKDAVKEVKDEEVRFSADGETGAIIAGNYNVGDIVIIEPNETYPEGKYAKITEIDGNVFKYVEPEMDEMFDHVVLTGTYDVEVLGVIPQSDEVVVDGIEGTPTQALQTAYGDTIYTKAKTSEDKNDADFKISGKDGKSIDSISLKLNFDDFSGSVKIKDINPTLDIDMVGPVAKKADVELSDTIEFSGTYKAIEEKKDGLKKEKTFSLAKIPCRVCGVVGIDVELVAKVSVTGEITVKTVVTTREGVNYKKGAAPKFIATGKKVSDEITAKAELDCKAELKATLVIATFDIASVGAYSGVKATAEFTSWEQDGKTGECLDLKGHVPAVIFINGTAEDTILGKLGITYEYEIWNSKSSPVKFEYHVEDFEIVEECTRKKIEEEEEEENKEEDEDGAETQSEIDTELIDFICNADSNIRISSFYVAMDEGTTDILKVTYVPEGYSKEDLVFSSNNSGVASVNSDGTILANSSGVAIIKVSSKDGKLSQSCAVYVTATYDVDFTPLINRSIPRNAIYI